MFPASGEITHVSDTALMVAACRAYENELEDAFVRDPFAARLAGERGVAILDVGCGLDTRPWRLDLSPDLRWIEIDFADVLDYKDGHMSDERSRCRRERLSVD